MNQNILRQQRKTSRCEKLPAHDSNPATRFRLLTLHLIAAVSTVFLACGTETISSQEALKRCICSSKSSQRWPVDLKQSLCQVARAEGVCLDGMSQQDCDELARENYEYDVATEMCDPVGGTERGATMKTSLTASEITDRIESDVTTWAADAALVGMHCLNIYADGTCRGWVLFYTSPTLEEGIEVRSILGLALSLEPTTLILPPTVPTGWIDSGEAATVAWQNAPPAVDHATAELVSSDQPYWIFYFGTWEGSSLTYDFSAKIDATTGEILP